MLGDVSPNYAAADHADQGTAYAISFGDVFLPVQTTILISDRPNFQGRQCVSEPMPPLQDFVSDIGCMCTKNKMSRIYANRNVAHMHDHSSSWNRPMREFVGQAVSLLRAGGSATPARDANTEHPVAGRAHLSSHPQPACVGLLDIRPKPFEQLSGRRFVFFPLKRLICRGATELGRLRRFCRSRSRNRAIPLIVCNKKTAILGNHSIASTCARHAAIIPPRLGARHAHLRMSDAVKGGDRHVQDLQIA